MEINAIVWGYLCSLIIEIYVFSNHFAKPLRLIAATVQIHVQNTCLTSDGGQECVRAFKKCWRTHLYHIVCGSAPPHIQLFLRWARNG